MELGGQKADGGNSSCNSPQEQQIKRSRSPAYYECTYCKRGFTNAQALGGHMNIHRKDKSKAKPKSTKSKPSPNHGYMSKDFPTHIPNPTFASGESSLYNSHMCYYSPVLPPPVNLNPTGQLGVHGSEPGFDLNLSIGPSRTRGYGDHDEVMEGDADDGDTMDLELRLGRHRLP